VSGFGGVSGICRDVLKMFLLGSPADDRIRRILADQKSSPFSYGNTGASRTLLPAEYDVQRDRFLLGEGSRVFYKAKEAAQQWRMFDIDWVRLYRPATRVAAKDTVAILVGRFGVWMVNLCRIVYVIDEPRRYGFAYRPQSSRSATIARGRPYRRPAIEGSIRVTLPPGRV